MPSDSPSDTANVLNGVSCPTATNCWAAGTQRASGKLDQTLVEVWSPSTTSWVKVTSDNMFDPSDATTVNQLNGVSCNSSTNCWAVGWFSNDKSDPSTTWHDRGLGLGLHWNGTNGTFDPVKIPSAPAEGVNYKLTGVSCVNDGFCVAVGAKSTRESVGVANGPNSFSGDEAFIALYNGATWEDVSPEEPDVNAEQKAELNGVSCVDTSHCMAVGRNEDHQPLAMETSGLDSQGNKVGGAESDTWFTLTDVTKGESAEFNGVSCITANNCWAAGTFADDHVDQSDKDLVDQALIGHWVGDGTHDGTGGNWNLADNLNSLSSNNPSEVDNELNGIHCESATLCFAVGSYDFGQVDTEDSPGTDQTLIDQFNGTSWSLSVANSGPPTNRTTDALDNELQDNELNGVDCLDVNNCVGVGEFDGGPPPVSNIEAPVTAAPDESPAEPNTDTLVLMWGNPTPGTTGTPSPPPSNQPGGGTGTGSTPSTSVQAAKVPVPATGGGGALPLILLAGAGVASLGSGIVLIRSRKR
ncbi:MAG: hypothetical protein ACREN2_10310 [Candidatus Dormibacteria bacterium]